MALRRLVRETLNRRARSSKGRIALYQTYHATLTVMRFIPSRVLFVLIVYLAVLRIPGSQLLPRIASPIVLRRLRRKRSVHFVSFFTWPFAKVSARALYGMRAYKETIKFIKQRAMQTRSRDLALLLAMALFELGEFEEARDCLKSFVPNTSLFLDPLAMQFFAYLELLYGQKDAAAQLLELAALRRETILRPHQNLSARYSNDYEPIELDHISGPAGRLFDAYNYVGQRVTHIGRGDLARGLYGAALHTQMELRTSEVIASEQCKAFLASLGIRLNNLRILPAEWATQIGHEGMLDILFRMRDLGWWSGKAVILAASEIVANHQFLSLFDKQARILIPGANVDDDIAAELFSLQRYCGMSFNAFLMQSGHVALWQEAGALLLRQWEGEGRGYPVRDEFDRRVEASKLTQSSVEHIKRSWGMSPDDWYVCLHMRDASHYNEAQGTGQAHRNTGTKNYKQVLKYITDKGGWVIKLGGPSSPKLPRMQRVIDYARGNYRSEMLDLHLIRNARYFIGTTSGLTNVAISFGVPSALVNCITTDAQLWGEQVRFAVKLVRLRSGRLISQRELTSTPWRWRTFSADVVAQNDAIIIDNTPDEILETVKEVELLAEGTPEKYAATVPEAEDLMQRWKASLDLPYFYGNGKPSLYFIKKHEKEFLSEALRPSLSGA